MSILAALKQRMSTVPAVKLYAGETLQSMQGEISAFVRGKAVIVYGNPAQEFSIPMGNRGYSSILEVLRNRYGATLDSLIFSGDLIIRGGSHIMHLHSDGSRIPSSSIDLTITGDYQR